MCVYVVIGMGQAMQVSGAGFPSVYGSCYASFAQRGLFEERATTCKLLCCIADDLKEGLDRAGLPALIIC